MYASKRNVLETVALLKAHGISQVVLSPGSRNAPLIQSFITDPFFVCQSIIDERSAAYLALGLALVNSAPVVLCCTSGSALLNYAPALAEAFYQQVPLVVLSADRSPAWIDQKDGQTLPQEGIYGPLVKLSVQLPEVVDAATHWACNRLVNEAILVCQRAGKGPVHLNIPLSEPLFDFSVSTLPTVRVIKAPSEGYQRCPEPLKSAWQKATKRLILVGQQPNDPALNDVLTSLATRCDCVILGEYLANVNSPALIGNFDALLTHIDAGTARDLAPDLLVTIGGHVVSKRVKQWLREQDNLDHWDFSATQRLADTYQHLSQWLTAPPCDILRALPDDTAAPIHPFYAARWAQHAALLPVPEPAALPFSDLAVTGHLLNRLPANASLLIGNSSPIRNVQYYPKPRLNTVYCNRGTNGIEGSLSMALGLTQGARNPLFVLLGDLSFIHDLGGLWTGRNAQNLRVLVINNGGGGIFHHVNGLELSPTLQHFVAANHNERLEAWVNAAGWDYLSADGHTRLIKALSRFTDTSQPQPMVLEVKTDPSANKEAVITFQTILKNALT